MLRYWAASGTSPWAGGYDAVKIRQLDSTRDQGSGRGWLVSDLHRHQSGFRRRSA
ncbi:MAG: hypothetical protein WDM89_14115 [Rhizomicrobium sp.]